MNTIDLFHNKLSELKKEIDTYDNEADRLINFFESEMKKLGQQFKFSCEKLDKKYGKSDISQMLSTISIQIANSIKEWEKKQRENIKAKKLRDIAKGNLLVIIYGKVKAGKSTLGNFVAKNAPGNIKPKFFVFDHAGKKNSIPKLEELNNDSFEVKSTECTTSIQGFEIPGLVWIDTPGLASMTGENGRLAKEYVNAADLVIYPMASDSPGRRTDTKEIEELAKARKSFAVLITKSDEIEEDEVNGEIVSVLKNKSIEARKKQEEYTRKEIMEILQKCSANEQLLGDILSISVMVAKKYPKNSKEWEQSNIPKFYKMLNKILDENAFKLKKTYPIREVCAFLENNVLAENKSESNSLLSHINNLEKMKKQLLGAFEELNKKEDDFVFKCWENVKLSVQEILIKAKDEKWDSKTIAKKITEIIKNNVIETVLPDAKDILSNFIKNLDAKFPTPALNTEGLEIKNKTKEIRITNIIAARGVGGAAGGATGAIVGGLIGGPIGAVIGGVVGGAAGSKIGEEFAEVSYKKIVIGDNYQEVEEKALLTSEQIVKKSVKLGIENFEKEIVKPLVSIIEEMIKNLDDAYKNIRKELKKCEI